MHLLVISTLASFLSVHSSYLTKTLCKWYNRMSPRERTLTDQKTCLKNEQSGLSTVKDFVQVSRLQRKINAIDEELKDCRSNRNSNSVFIRIGLNYGLKGILGFLMFFLSIYYRKVPVFIVDLKYDLFPFSELISFPNDYVNSVSVHFWMICCSSVARLINY